ncbi:16063_t:CDS:2, partial [Cetraspora pellucida]
TSNISVPTTSSMPVISSTIPNVSIILLVIHNTPVTPFTDFTNLHMLLQQHYLSAQLFNSLVLNKTNNESEEPSIIDNSQPQVKKNLQSIDDSSNTNTTSGNKQNN